MIFTSPASLPPCFPFLFPQPLFLFFFEDSWDKRQDLLHTKHTLYSGTTAPALTFVSKLYIFNNSNLSSLIQTTVSFPKSCIKIFLYIEGVLRRVPCSLGYPQTYYVAEVELELLILLLPKFVPLSMACFFNFFFFLIDIEYRYVGQD